MVMKELINPSIESTVVKLLQKGSLPVHMLIDQVNQVRPKTTKQSVYLALRNLRKKEVVIMANKIASLDHLWIKNMKDFFGTAESIYMGKNTGETFLDLKDGENIEYRFKSPLATDIFWAHAFSILFGSLKKMAPIFLYNPHQWFLIVRRKTEKQLMQESKKTGHPWLQIIANNTPLDLKARNEFKGDMNRCQVLTHNTFSENYYVNIFGDFLIEAWLDKDTSSKIDSVYKNNSELEKASLMLSEIVTNNKGKNRLRISCNQRKAQKIKKLFGKYFIF